METLVLAGGWAIALGTTVIPMVGKIKAIPCPVAPEIARTEWKLSIG